MINVPMNLTLLSVIGCMLLFNSCAPKVTTKIHSNYSSLDYREEVRIFRIQDPIPPNSEDLGTVKIRDNGFSINCGFDVVIDKAKMEARKAGGNAIKITEHIPPSTFGSSCHQITARIIKVNNFDGVPIAAEIDSSLLNADYALLHVYRHSGAGALINFDLHLGDTVICRVKNKWKTTVKIQKDGRNTLWAKTEVKKELPINIQFGHEYYIRCSITMGAFVGHPQLDLVDNQSGKLEFESINHRKKIK